MTNHADLSRQLALALGYYPESVRVDKKHDFCEVYGAGAGNPRCMRLEWTGWDIFDYREPDVCLPLIKWLMVEHNSVARTLCGRFAVGIAGTDTKPWRDHLADTLELAVARAVIAVGVR